MRNPGNLGHVRNNWKILWEKRYFIPAQRFVLLYNFGQQQTQNKMEMASTWITVKQCKTPDMISFVWLN